MAGARPRYRLRVALLGLLVARMSLAFLLVFATYNPGGHSWFHWVQDPSVDPEWRLIGSGALLLALGIVVPGAIRGLGVSGILASFATLGAIAAVPVEAGLIVLQTTQSKAWLAVGLVAGTLGIGLTWMNLAIALDGVGRARDFTRVT